jgi:hypothetical protein
LKEPHGGWYGRWDAHWDGTRERDVWDEIAFIPTELDRFLTERGYRPAEVLTGWRERGWLYLDAEGKNRKNRIRIWEASSSCSATGGYHSSGRRGYAARCIEAEFPSVPRIPAFGELISRAESREYSMFVGISSPVPQFPSSPYPPLATYLQRVLCLERYYVSRGTGESGDSDLAAPLIPGFALSQWVPHQFPGGELQAIRTTHWPNQRSCSQAIH